MNITVVPGNRLTDEHVSLWSGMQRANPSWGSPCLCPEFVQAVAAVRKDVEIGIMQHGGQVSGFFPYQRGWWAIGRPVGGPLSDFQAVIARRETEWDPSSLVQGCGLSAWRFDHLLATQEAFQTCHRGKTPSPYLDLSGGLEGYLTALRCNGSKRMDRIQRLLRTAQRKVGPLRFEFHTTDDTVFETLLHWKANQYQRTKHTNILAIAWVRCLLERIRQAQGEGFAGVLSALYLGDRLAAVHLGMRSHNVLHYWFPSYDVDLAPFSPGTLCLSEIIRESALRGIVRIDLGKGNEPYKTQLMSGATTVAEGIVACDPSAHLLDTAWHRAQAVARVPVVGTAARCAARLTRSLRRQLLFR